MTTPTRTDLIRAFAWASVALIIGTFVGFMLMEGTRIGLTSALALQ